MALQNLKPHFGSLEATTSKDQIDIGSVKKLLADLDLMAANPARLPPKENIAALKQVIDLEKKVTKQQRELEGLKAKATAVGPGGGGVPKIVELPEQSRQRSARDETSAVHLSRRQDLSIQCGISGAGIRAGCPVGDQQLGRGHSDQHCRFQENFRSL